MLLALLMTLVTEAVISHFCKNEGMIYIDVQRKSYHTQSDR